MILWFSSSWGSRSSEQKGITQGLNDKVSHKSRTPHMSSPLLWLYFGNLFSMTSCLRFIIYYGPQTLLKKCPCLAFFWSIFSRIQLRENTGQKNSEYGHFSYSEIPATTGRLELQTSYIQCSWLTQ